MSLAEWTGKQPTWVANTVQKIRGHQSGTSTDSYHDINVVDIVERTKGLTLKEKFGI